MGVIYRHPKQNLNDFIQKISKCLDNLNKRNKTYYICEDINVDFLSCDKNKKIKNYCDSLSSYGCMSFLNFPTRVTSTSSTLIDHLYSNDTRNDIKCKILIHDISDHFPFIFSVNTAPTSTTAKILKKRDMKFFYCENFLLDLSSAFDKSLLNKENFDAHIAFKQFIDIFQITLNKHAPLRELTRREKKLRRKPWITHDVLNIIKAKNKLYKLKVKNPTDKDIADQYRLCRNKLTHIKEESKKSYYRDILSDNMHNSSQIRRTVNDIVRYKSKQKHNLPSFFIDEHNIILKDPVKISNSFNNYFANVGSLLAAKITSSNNHTVFQYPSAAQIPASFFLKPILEEEVIKQLRNLKASKSSGAYHIPNKIIKLSTVIIAPILTKLFNDSIRQGVFPDVLKIAQVVLIHKSGSKHKFSNYRPISILSSFSKIFEKCLYNQISSYLTKKKNIKPSAIRL